MRLSLFRSKSSTSSPKPSKNRLAHMWSPSRTKSDSGNDAVSSPNSLPPLSPLEITSDVVSSDDHNSHLHPFSANNAPFFEDVKDSSSNVYADSSTMDEREMARKLMDVESSFIPDLPVVEDSSLTNRAKSDGTSRRYIHPSQPSPSQPDANVSQTHTLSENSSDISPSPGPDHESSVRTKSSTQRKKGSSRQEEDYLELPDSSFVYPSSQQNLSSPSAAAAQRSKLRAASSRSPPYQRDNAIPAIPAVNVPVEDTPPESDDTPKKVVTSQSNLTQSQPLSSNSMVARQNSASNLSAPSMELSESQRIAGKRPSYLQNHQASQRSSTSSFASQAVSEATVGAADFALQSGGAAADREDPSVRPSREHSRLPSLGSIASSFSGDTEKQSNQSRKRTASGAFTSPNGNLERLVEGDSPSSTQETPKAKVGDVTQPTDTVLAQHVRDVEVPDTVAREYRATHRHAENETKGFLPTPQYGRGKSNLTLKEQNSKIDKLSKENFDLKLKIHYLHQALQDRSDEGVKDLLDKNAQLQAELVKSKKENQSLRRRLREVERNQAEPDRSVLRSRRGWEGSEDDYNSFNAAQSPMEEEVAYLRDRNHMLEEENERLARRGISHSRGFGDDADDAYRQQAEKEIQVLREEIARLRSGRSPRPHLRLRPSDANMSTGDRSPGESPKYRHFDATQDKHDVGSGFSGSSTLVEQLRQENADLRRDLGAQTSMLSSRNRERERLQQEIEDLKLVHRRDGALSSAGDSILDRSVSRNNFRPTSRGGVSARSNQMSDSDREYLESVQATLRDDNAALRMRVQDLQKALNEQRDQAHYYQRGDPDEERAVRSLNGGRAEIDYLENLLVQKDDEMAEVMSELRTKEEESDALQLEIRSIGESLNRLIDDMEANESTIQNLQEELTQATGEIEAMDKNLHDAAAAKERLEVQAESSQNEISFLREEQESDKIKIGELQTALRHAKTNLRDEKVRAQEMEDLEADATKARDEARTLRRSLASKESEANATKDRLEELETAMREAFGSFDGTKANVLREITKIQRDLENALHDHDNTKLDLGEKDRILKERDTLLETSNHELRKVTDLLEKERHARKQDRNEFEKAQRSGRLANPEARIVELEQARTQDRKKLATLEQKYKEQLVERHKLLFSVWQRLSNLCGADWSERHGNLDEQGTPTTADTIPSHLAAFSKNVALALKTIENVFFTFHTRVLNAEKEISKDYAKLEKSLESRARRLDRVEKAVAAGAADAASTASHLQTAETAAQLKHENKLLRRELKFLKQGSFALPGLPSPGIEEAPSSRSRSRNAHSAAHGFNVPRAEEAAAAAADAQPTTAAPLTHQPKHPSSATDPADQRWILRFEELNRRLHAEQAAKAAEREARLLDRTGARKRIEEQKNESEALRRELERERGRKSVREGEGEGEGVD